MMNRIISVVLCAPVVIAARADIVHTMPPEPITAFWDGATGGASAPLDIDNDGVPEFNLHAFREGQFPQNSGGIYMQTSRAGVFLRVPEYLEIFEVGSVIGPPDTYVYSGRADMQVLYPAGGGGGGIVVGVWEYDEPPAYFGFMFDIDGRSHYGWALAQLVSNNLGGIGVSVFEYAYESTPGVPIFAGQVPAPGAAVLMSAGVFGLALRRRRP